MPPRRDGVHFNVNERVAEYVTLRKQPQRIVSTENLTCLVLLH